MGVFAPETPWMPTFPPIGHDDGNFAPTLLYLPCLSSFLVRCPVPRPGLRPALAPREEYAVPDAVGFRNFKPSARGVLHLPIFLVLTHRGLVLDCHRLRHVGCSRTPRAVFGLAIFSPVTPASLEEILLAAFRAIPLRFSPRPFFQSSCDRGVNNRRLFRGPPCFFQVPNPSSVS